MLRFTTLEHLELCIFEESIEIKDYPNQMEIIRELRKLPYVVICAKQANISEKKCSECEDKNYVSCCSSTKYVKFLNKLEDLNK